MNFTNLNTLKRYLESEKQYISDHYSVASYLSGGTRLAHIMDHDGETADMVGWGALSGIPALSPVAGEEWVDYLNRVYGTNPVTINYLFSEHWPDDLSQCIARLDQYTRDRQIPTDFHHLKYDYKVTT